MPEGPLPIAVVTTVDRRETARSMARSLVERGLAACAQISAIESIYVWQGEIRREREFRLLLKTVAENYAVLEQAIRSLHPYELPAIHAIAFERVSTAYGAWIEEHSAACANARSIP